ncbi:hypothetical protein ACFY15_26955 [Streptomyces sp. NPDC001373]|uniref:hypothetical protein n=1 Tax=Streptomyces sp. NPDC001373 TaxID=3364565 RepID=UPI003681BC7D
MGSDRKKEQGERAGRALPPRTAAPRGADAAPFLAGRQLTRSSVQAVGNAAGNAAATAFVQRVSEEDRGKADERRKRWAERDLARGGGEQAEEFTTRDTPYGPFNHRRGRGGAPFVTTNARQYPGTERTDGRYVREEENQYIGLIPALDAEHFLPLVDALKGRKPTEEEIDGLSDDQCRAAATIMGVADAERVREPGALKQIRAALRRQARPEHEAPEFLNDFPQGRIGGAQHEREIRAGRRRRATPEVETILEASSSSDESTDRQRK